ncbi:hypothetical protein K490DRAFT_36592, partial [Saccharata proteae CBS 121410]
LLQEIETWVAALAAYDNNEFDESLRCFSAIADTSKILFNMGVIHATLGEHEKAVDCYQRAVTLDMYLAVAYFQQGVSNFLMGDFEEALANFNDTLLYLRGNNDIDYEQLGLKFKLYSCEVLFNRGLCYIYLQQKDAGMQDLSFAAKEKVIPDHDVIDEAIKEQAEGYTVFSIPVGIVYRPNEAKVKNLKTKDYLGKARLIAATDRSNAFTGLSNAELRRMNENILNSAKDDRPLESRSYAATNLVKPHLMSRSRQQSEPPINRNVFPPTPPPEADRPPAQFTPDRPVGRTHSLRNAAPRPAPLDLGRVGFEQAQKPRLGTQRSASERPRSTRDHSSSHRTARDEASSRNGTRPAHQTHQRPVLTSDEEDNAYPIELYNIPDRTSGGSIGRAHHQHGRSRSRHQRPMYIAEEEDEATSSPNGLSSLDEADFEIPTAHPNSRMRTSNPKAAPTPTTPFPGHNPSTPVVRTIRVKVHAEDTRYVFIEPTKRFEAFADQVRNKFGLKGAFRVKIRDEEGDLITMSDQEDLDMAVGLAKEGAGREGVEMGKMEVSFHDWLLGVGAIVLTVV